MQTTPTTDFPKKYYPKDFEDKIYKIWEKSDFFKPKDRGTGNTYCISMPPPNVTGKLHLGHAIMTTLEDIMIRYHRMKGDETLWIPGTDHASIATELKVEEKMKGIGKTKKTMPREEFLKECWKWTEKYGGLINDQLRSMGASCDWTRERFAMDEGTNKLVNKVFVDLYNKGLVYRGEYMVNYDPVLETVVSDQEVKYKEEKGKLYYINYFVSGSDNEVVIATTRPETLLGDVAVAVNPKDKRYKKLLRSGKTLILPIVNKEIPIIADEEVDMDFGTGAVKITPAHDASDFYMAKRHNLPLNIVVIDKKGDMTELAGIFSGQNYKMARENIVELLRSKGNLLKSEDHISRVMYSERGNTRLETVISKQWFIKVESIVKKVISGYKSKDFEIIPKRFNKTFEEWVYNMKDWCISRQLIWGHQIPVWYSKQDDKIFVGETQENAEKQAKDFYGKEVELERETDVFDTWFSSGLWPQAILDFDFGKEKQQKDYEKFYPNSMLETGHDIIFFWVIRMLMFGYEITGETPFKKIYFHGLVRDKLGRKMSKSLGNGIDPLDMIDEYSSDALRMTLSIGNTAGNDLKFDEENVKNNSTFINKLWNASRFVYTKLDKYKQGNISQNDIENIEKKLIDNYENLKFHEKWILSRIKYLSSLVSEDMENYNFSEGGIELQSFTKNEFCDYYIEEFKLSESEMGEDVIIYIINNLLKLLHPYIPFVTEEIFKKLGFKGDLVISSWPNLEVSRNENIEKDKKLVIDIIKQVRNLRAENNVRPNKSIGLKIYALNKNAQILSEAIDIIAGIVKADSCEIINKKPEDNTLAYGIIKNGIEVYVDTSNALDIEKEKDRLKEKIIDTKEYISILDKKLLNESFVRNAPDHLVRAEMSKKASAEDKLFKLEEKFKKL